MWEMLRRDGFERGLTSTGLGTTGEAALLASKIYARVEQEQFLVRYLIAPLAMAAFLSTSFVLHHSDQPKPVSEDPLPVVEAYLKAIYARDYVTAYRYISSRDQRVWDEKSYARQYVSFTGFALELAQKLAANMKIRVIQKQLKPDRTRYQIGYEAPTADELSSLLMDWDQDKLNALSRAQQEQLRTALDNLKKTGKMITLKGQETFSLIPEGGNWKIFHDWASANKVSFKLAVPAGAAIDAQMLNDELLIKRDEPFEIALKVRNRGREAVTARIIHHVAPRSLENNIEMIACGALQPLVLRPNDEQEISMAYLIRHGIRAGTKIAVTYELKLEPMQPKSRVRGALQRAPAVRPTAAWTV